MFITLKNVSVAFGGRQILSIDQARFEAGTICGVVGPSGSGKSTLLSVIAGVLRSAGTVQLHFPTTEQTPRAPGPSDVAWVPQGAFLLPERTVLDNVRMGALANGADLESATKLALEHLQAVSLRARHDSRASALSGGETQRVAFARALASPRPILLADEPTASLDRNAARNVANLLTDLPRDRIVIIATHDQALMDRCDALIDLGSTP